MEAQVKAHIEALDKARDDLALAIYAAMDHAFRQHGFDTVRVNAYDTWFTTGRQEKSHVLGEVSVPEYDELEGLYLRRISPQGFEGHWTKETGWEDHEAF